MNEKVSVKVWLIGVAVFVLVLLSAVPIAQEGVTFTIVDHQAAGTAEQVDAIQTQWREAGVRNFAILSVIADLAWIWLYALGAFLAGKGFAARRGGVLRAIGYAVCIAAVVFAICDYTETILQFIQLLNDEGDETMAGAAASAQPVKMLAFVVTFIGVIAALVIDRLTANPA